MSQRQVLEALSGLILGMFVSMLASTVVSSSLPVIVSDLGGTQTSYTWVVTATLLTTAISTPIWGKLADLTNRKFLYQLAIVIFVVATAIAGFSHDTTLLIAMRAVQGIGAGGLAALSQVLMADIISPRERGKYMGLFVMVQLTLKLPAREQKKTTIDYAGIVFLSVAVSSLLIWVSNAGSTTTDDAGNALAFSDLANNDWWSLLTVLMVGGAIIATILFIVVEITSREPLIPLSLFRNKTFTLSVIASIATGLAMFGSSVFLSQYMQLSRGATPTMAGVMTIPMIAGLLLSSIIIGAFISKFGKWKSYLVVGAILLIAGSYLLSTIHYDTNFALVSLYMFLLGAGVGMTMQNLVLVVQNDTDPREIGVASSGVTFFRSLGGTIGVSVMGAALASKVASLMTSSETADRFMAAVAETGEKGAAALESLGSGTLPKVSELPEAIARIVEDVYAQGISHSFLIGVPFAVISLIAIVFMPNKPLTRMTTSERTHASEADLATVSVSEGMGVLTATGSVTVVDADAADSATDKR
jgi:MFS family permease